MALPHVQREQEIAGHLPKSPRGLELVLATPQKADIVVENMAPSTIERLGLGDDEAKKLNPGIIFCQIEGSGTGSNTSGLPST